MMSNNYNNHNTTVELRTPGRLPITAYLPFGLPAPILRMWSPPPPTYILPPGYMSPGCRSPPPNHPISAAASTTSDYSPTVFALSGAGSPVVHETTSIYSHFSVEISTSNSPTGELRENEALPEDQTQQGLSVSFTEHDEEQQGLEDRQGWWETERRGTIDIINDGRIVLSGMDEEKPASPAFMSVFAAKLLASSLVSLPASGTASPRPTPGSTEIKTPGGGFTIRTPHTTGPVCPGSLYRALIHVCLLRSQEGPALGHAHGKADSKPVYPPLAESIPAFPFDPAKPTATATNKGSNIAKAQRPVLRIATDTSKLASAAATPSATPPSAPLDLTKISAFFSRMNKASDIPLANTGFTDDEIIAYFEQQFLAERQRRAEWANKARWFEAWLDAQLEEDEDEEDGQEQVEGQKGDGTGGKYQGMGDNVNFNGLIA